MSFQRRLKFFLVHTLFISNKEAQILIDKGEVEINGQIANQNCLIDTVSEIKVQGKLLRQKTVFTYLKFYKPRGYVSCLNLNVANNLSAFFTAYTNMAIAGRLDKDSEGLLLLSNDGVWVEKMCNPDFEKEKEYLVTLNKEPDHFFIETFSKGVKIGNYVTKPCHCAIAGSHKIKVILTEGKNRQIRRMCKALNYEVKELIRVRTDAIFLQPLKPGEMAIVEIV